jgi:hypothetical protein
MNPTIGFLCPLPRQFNDSAVLLRHGPTFGHVHGRDGIKDFVQPIHGSFFSRSLSQDR